MEFLCLRLLCHHLIERKREKSCKRFTAEVWPGDIFTYLLVAPLILTKDPETRCSCTTGYASKSYWKQLQLNEENAKEKHNCMYVASIGPIHGVFNQKSKLNPLNIIIQWLKRGGHDGKNKF